MAMVLNDTKVSIIVPVYNVQDYLPECIDSLIKQTHKNLQIILVDDGSTDESGYICDNYRNRDSRVQVIHKANGRLSSSRQAGMNAVSGDYVMFVDGDDWLDAETIEKCVNEVSHDESIGCVLFSYVKETENGSIPMHVMDGGKTFDKNEVRHSIHRRLFGLSNEELNHPERMENIVSCCMKLYRTDIAKQGRYFDTKDVGSCEDGLFNIYALHDCEKAVYVDKPYYHYRKREGSLVKSYKPNFREQWERLHGIMQSYIDENRLDRSYQEALDNRIALSITAIALNKMRDVKSSAFEKIKYIGSYLKSTIYHAAVVQMDMSRLPTIWRLMLLCSKWRLASVVYLGMQVADRKIRGGQ